MVTIIALAGITAAGIYTWSATPIYSSSVQLFISTSAGSDLNQLNQGGTFTQQRVKSYADIVTSSTVMRSVIKDLSLPYSPEQLASSVKAESPADTVLLNVSVTDPSPKRAKAIAESISTEFPRFIQAIETPTGAKVSPVKVSVTRAAILASDPVSPKAALNIVAGLLLGLALGITAAVLRRALDRTIHHTTEVVKIADAPLLGTVIDDPKAKERPLISGQDPSPRAEAYRQLRTNIRFLSVDRKIGIFVVTSALSGDGKTTTATNLAISLAQSGQQVVLIDADLRRPTVADRFAVSGAVGLTNVLMGEVPANQAVQRWRPDTPLFLLPAGPTPPNPSELLGSAQLSKMIESFRASGVTVVFDSPPLLPVTDAAILARATDGALVVARVGKTRTDQLEGAVEALRTAGAPILGVIANRVKRNRKSSAYGGYYAATTPKAVPRQTKRSEQTKQTEQAKQA
ncbi:polysaccharide biosynthesis tyrosine autokinase [Paractinoplanes maris]|uniref:polysaccharide biosynthesis tyrosine autokinase n=1 Tax=Paractinoplanes maris TaxID=1734446 RepID=UPI0020220329|nr:polysaccharide biosynthesis tyrosine autokinase [Actinoplanes maris]